MSFIKLKMVILTFLEYQNILWHKMCPDLSNKLLKIIQCQ
jgi:hypothetical protein